MTKQERISIAYNYLRSAGTIHTQRDLAELMNTAESNVSKALKGHEKFLTNSFLRRMNKAVDDIFNDDWLLDGNGSMLTGDDNQKKDDISYRLVPLINIDSVGGMDSRNDITDTAQYVEKLVPFEKAQEGDIAIYQSGESMSPTIPPGSVMLLRRVTGWREYFGYGEIFVVLLTDGRRITKEINRSQTDERGNVLCVSHNPDYPNEELPRAMIADVWKVVKILTDIGW